METEKVWEVDIENISLLHFCQSSRYFGSSALSEKVTDVMIDAVCST